MKKILGISLICLIVVLSFLTLIYKVEKGDQRILDSYSQLKDQKHIVKQVDATFVDDLIENNKTYVLMMGFERCPWCQQLMPYYNEVAKNNHLEEIYYLDILEMRTNEDSVDRPVYEKLYAILQSIGDTASRIGAPTIFFVKDGTLKAYHVGTVDGHEKVDRVLPPMTDDQIKELRNILDMEFKKVTS